MSQPSGAPASPPAAEGARGAAPARRHGGGTAIDMVRSLLVIGVLVAIVVLAVPRPQGRIMQPVDVAAATEQAAAGGLPVSVPVVPDDWRANAATFEPDPVEGLPTWSVGYLLPDESFVGVRVTTGATPGWVAGVTSNGQPDGQREAAGRTWEQLVSESGAGRRSLLAVEGQVTTVITGSADDAALDTLAAGLSAP